MPRAPSEKVEQAKKLYDSGMKLVEIASQLKVPDGTVRRWKCTYNWDNDSERSKKVTQIKTNARKKNKNENNKAVAKEIESVMNNTELNEKQRLFCLHYIRSFNATKAYQKVYECSYNTAMANGSQLLGNAKIKATILQLKQERYSREFITEADIFQKYMDIAFADISDFLSWGQEEIPVMGPFGPIVGDNGEVITEWVNVVRFNESTELDGTLISEVKQGKNGASIKLADRMKALDWLADHMDMATEKQRAEIALLKAKSQTDEQGDTEDDGFIDALSGKVDAVWEE